MTKKRFFVLEFLLLLIIAIPLFSSLLNNLYFPMHDAQHIARLYLLDKGIWQGDFFPRWVDTLGFSFGYPLFNYYPPLIYYVAEVFHLLGFSLIWSIKLMLITGFLLSIGGMHLFLRRKLGTTLALVGATLYAYLSYHAILVYVRGAFAEFFAMALLPFVFLTLENLLRKKTVWEALLFAITFALLILAHPLISFPFLIFLAAYGLFFLFRDQQKKKLIIIFASSVFLGLALSAFFWMPAMLERNFTQIDLLSTTNLASYSLHYICPEQFLYSPWGFGGSIPGCQDGLSFQLGKVYIGLIVLSLVTAAVYWLRKKKFDAALQFYGFYLALAAFCLFMATQYSSFIWDNVGLFSYLQFPWRMLTFAGFFISAAAAFTLFFAKVMFKGKKTYILASISILVVLSTMILYQKYFRPQGYIYTNDQNETTFEKIAWDVSLTSLDFIPQGVPTKQLNADRKTVAIDKSELRQDIYGIHKGTTKRVDVLKNNFAEKEFNLEAFVPVEFWLFTFNFPGWKAYLNEEEFPIKSNETFGLIQADIPQGFHSLKFVFTNTPLRTAANWTSFGALIVVGYLLVEHKFKKVKRRLSAGLDKSL